MIITLCGSTRFMEAFGDWNVILTKAGHVVYTVCTSFKGDALLNHNPVMGDEDETKRRFDLIHLQKISNSDAILVLNVDGYYGESTRREIEWARMNRKQVYWLNNAKKHPDEETGRVLGPAVWTIYELFNDGPIANLIETKKYRQP